MTGTEVWRTLALPEEAPQLLVKTRFDEDGYDIQLTDLGRVWGETLTKAAIVKRANEEGCSIDASEDDQYQIMLKKISCALKSSSDTTLLVMPSDDGREVSLEISAELPGSLPTFKWYPVLQIRPNSALSAGIVTPLLLQAYNLQYNIQQLIDEIASKDRVIAKITDRLEASGNDLTSVFPGVSNIKTNRKRSQRDQLATHVRGLADFDEALWRATAAESHERGELSTNVLDRVLQDMPMNSDFSAHSESPDDWWRVHGTLHAGGYATGQVNGSSKFRKNKPLGTPKSSLVVNDEEAGFQRQDTPPNLRNKAGTPSTVVDEPDSVMDHDAPIVPDQTADDETTEDEDDLDAVPSRGSSRTKGRSQEEPVSKAPKKLGVVGGKKVNQDSLQDASNSSPSQTARSKLGAFGGSARSKSPQINESTATAPSKPKTRLGAFGGKAKPTSEPKSPSPAKQSLGKFGGKKSQSSAPPAEDEVPMTPSRGLGVMGGSGRRSATPQPPVSGQGDIKTESQSLEEEPIVEEEGPDEKRERLKRELEEKAKVPVKKKRKF